MNGVQEIAASEEISDPLAEAKPIELTGDKSVTFDNSVFSRMDGAHFRKSDQTDEPVFVVKLGDEEALLPFPGMRREFDIELHSHDDKMLGMITESLNFLKFMAIGDAIPNELLTGEASWRITDANRQFAYQRLSMQLVTWMSNGDEVQVTDPDQLMQIAEDPATKQKIALAFSAAAKDLGYGEGEGEKVFEHIDELAEELAFIDTLRGKFRDIVMITEKLEKLIELFRREHGVKDLLQDLLIPVSQLTGLAREDFQARFDAIDNQTSEIIVVLQNLDAKKVSIRRSRDDLYKRLMAWDDLLASWHNAQVSKSKSVIELVRDTYRFLAPRYMQVQEWKLSSSIANPPPSEDDDVLW
jgi:hypothetical protein